MCNLFSMKLKNPIGIILFFVAITMTFESEAQCKRFTQKNCLPTLSPYTNNGQINSTTLYEGDSASMNMTFYSLLDYRLMVCAHPVLGEGAFFRVKDGDGEVIYSSQGKTSNYWDFRVNSTQDLHIDVVIPEDGSDVSDMPPSGCVSIILGFKE